jgi:hypothetical protein
MFQGDIMEGRKAIPKKLRFEVFKRDSFTCQYCGKSAPDIILEVDHIHPVSRGGEEDITNLITSCFDCNRGKGARELSDNTVLAKQKMQLDKLQERREQIEMMLEWQVSLVNIEEQEVAAAVDFINSFMHSTTVSESGANKIKGWIKKFGLSEILESTRLSANQYLLDDSGRQTEDTIRKYFDYIYKIANNRKRLEKKPYLADLYRIRNVLNYRGFYVNPYKSINLLEEAYLAGCDIDKLEQIANVSSSWTDWNERMEAVI